MHLMTNTLIFVSFKEVGLSGEQTIDMYMDVILPMRMIISRKKD